MLKRLLLCLSLTSVLVPSAWGGPILTFDDLTTQLDYLAVPGSYQGFTFSEGANAWGSSTPTTTWAYSDTATPPSASNFVYNYWGYSSPASTWLSLSTPAQLSGGYFAYWAGSDAPAYYSSDSLTIEGFRGGVGGTSVGSVTIPLAASFSYHPIDLPAADTWVFRNTDTQTGLWLADDPDVHHTRADNGPVARGRPGPPGGAPAQDLRQPVVGLSKLERNNTCPSHHGFASL